jgi:curli biogenesis system outer membrane secretion channel CsgG
MGKIMLKSMKLSFLQFILTIALLFVFADPQVVIGQAQSAKKQQAVKRGLQLFKAGDLDASEDVFEQILAHDNKTLIAKEMLAVISYRKEEYSKAEKLARLCLAQNRKSAKAHLVLAGIYYQRGNILAARDHLRKSKKFATPREKGAIAQYLKDDTRISIENTEKSLIKKPDQFSQIQKNGKMPFVAVFSFEDSNEEDDPENLGMVFSEMLTTALIQTNRFQVLERTQLDKILEEQALGLTGAIDDETAVDVGELIGIDAVVVGSSRHIEDLIEIDARIVDAQSGKAYLAASVSAEDESELRQASFELAEKLAAAADKVPVDREESETDN